MVTPEDSVEGRGAANGKPDQGNAIRTQGRDVALTELARVGQRARRNKEERFGNLLCHLKVPLLEEAFFRLRRDAAVGVDEVSWREYSEELHARLASLQDRIHRGSYHPQPVRRVHIPKGDGRTRPLGIAALEDKIVQQAAKMILEHIYEPSFLGFSYGFRPGRSQHDALDALAVALGRKVNWVLDADIASFFDSVCFEWVQRFIEHRISDRRFVRLVMRWMRAGVVEDGERHEVERGTPQGAVISPVLSNVYLHYVIDLWTQQWRNRHAHGPVYMVRYADDLVLGFQYEQDARAMRSALAERLAKFGLTLHPEKTRVVRFGRFAQAECGRDGRHRPETFGFLGFTHICGKDRKGRFALRRRTSCKKRKAKLAALRHEARRRRHEPAREQHRWLSAVLRGHYNYYGVPGNFTALCSFYRAVETLWFRSLQHRSDRARWTRAQRDRFRRNLPLPPPRITHPWPEKRFALR
ncbi:group II intron reverse transcriptase/maturase [Sorangium sp. So ce118]